jgi:hypothetical protein
LMFCCSNNTCAIRDYFGAQNGDIEVFFRLAQLVRRGPLTRVTSLHVVTGALPRLSGLAMPVVTTSRAAVIGRHARA